MPHPLHAIRDDVGLQDRASHRLVAYMALEDIAVNRMPRHQWAHPRLAEQLGTDRRFTALVSEYLSYRRAQWHIGGEKGICLFGAQCAQVYLCDPDLPRMPLDLINLHTSGDRVEQMAALLEVAAERRLRVDPDTMKAVEARLGRSCGLPWDAVVSTFHHQQQARNTLAMEASAA